MVEDIDTFMNVVLLQSNLHSKEGYNFELDDQ